MTDLATLSLGHAPTNELTLAERRDAHEGWLASDRRTPPPLGDRYTGRAHTERADDGGQPLTEKRALLVGHAMKAGVSVGEIDQTELCKVAYKIADEVIRTDNKPVPKDLTPELRARLATAALNILEPPMRTDEDVKSAISGKSGEQPKPPPKPGSSPLNRRADDEEEKPRKVQDDDDEAPTLTAVMDAIGALNKRFDAFEAKGKSNDDDDDDDDRERDKLFFSGQDVIKTIVAVFAPMITGSIESLSSILGKA